MEDNAARRKDFAERFGGGESSANMYRYWILKSWINVYFLTILIET